MDRTGPCCTASSNRASRTLRQVTSDLILDIMRTTAWSAVPGWVAVVGRAEASMDVVVDHADVLHERIHARWADEAVYPCDFSSFANPPPAGSRWVGPRGTVVPVCA